MLPNDDFKRGQVYSIFPEFYQPVPYKGTFDIGESISKLRKNMPVLSVEEGYLEYSVNAAADSFGPFCSLSEFRAKGKMLLNSVYGFSIIYGLARAGLQLRVPSFGHAKLFPEQPKVECSLQRATLSHKIIRSSVEITIKLAEEVDVNYYRPQ